MPGRITQTYIEEPGVGSTIRSLVSTAPAQISVSQKAIYRLLENEPLLQEIIEGGNLTITSLPDASPSGAPPMVMVSLFGYSTRATLIKQLGGTIAIEIGDILIPLSLLERPIPFSPDTLATYTKAHTAIVPKPRSPFDEAIERIRKILSEQPPQPEVHITPVSHIPYQVLPATADTPAVAATTSAAPTLTWESTLSELNSLIARINDPAIKKQTIAVKNALIALAKQGEDKTNLAGILNLTSRLLTAAPGEERKALASQCKLLALTKQQDPSPAWKALGIAMIIMGTLILGLGVLACIAAGPIGAAPVIGGALILAGGVGMFTRGCSHPEPQKLMNKLSDSIVKAPSAVTSV
jgi:hypothetical protein